METKIKCTSCKTELTNYQGSTAFDCPNCNKNKITRCHKCRELSTKYKCTACDFEGPN